MSELNYNVRMIQKIGTEKEWLNSNLIPKKGEIIVYAAEDENTELPTGRTYPIGSARIKIGDGVLTAKDLPYPNSYYEDILDAPDFNTYMSKYDPVGSGSLQMNPIKDHTSIEWETEGSGVSLGMECAARDQCLAGGYATYIVGSGTCSFGWGDHLFIPPDSGDPVAVFGRYNEATNADEIKFMFGDGSSESDRSNAMTLDYLNDLWIKGSFYFGGTSKANSTKLAPYTAGEGISIDNNEISLKLEWGEF